MKNKQKMFQIIKKRKIYTNNNFINISIKNDFNIPLLDFTMLIWYLMQTFNKMEKYDIKRENDLTEQ